MFSVKFWEFSRQHYTKLYSSGQSNVTQWIVFISEVDNFFYSVTMFTIEARL